MERGAGFAEDGAGSRRARKKERTRRAIYAAALGLFREPCTAFHDWTQV